jgi:quercetin dioxygenase-like cupin family protein
MVSAFATGNRPVTMRRNVELEVFEMPVERAVDHPVHELGGNAVTSLASPSRGSSETALFRIDLPAGSGLPPHRHDHFDVFAVVAGGGTVHLDDEAIEVTEGDSAVVPIGVRHWLDAGPGGVTIVVTMVAATKLIRDDGSESVPPWVG